MFDHASKLRKLIAESAPTAAVESVSPPMIVVTGGKGGVGTTTVALNLAVALTHHGHRTVLADLGLQADLANLAGVNFDPANSISNGRAGPCSPGEVIQYGPAGVLLLPSRWAPGQAQLWSDQVPDCLLLQVADLRADADVLVVDSGSGMTDWTHRLWHRASLVLLVTTCEDIGIMDSYATIKQAKPARGGPEIRLLVNRFDFATAAADAERRIAAACRRFLGRAIRPAPRLPRCDDSGIASAGVPQAWEAPKSHFGRSVSQLARFAADVLARRQNSPLTIGPSLIPIQEFSAC
jgi:flagellar biosynthesis protein FlhG